MTDSGPYDRSPNQESGDPAEDRQSDHARGRWSGQNMADRNDPRPAPGSNVTSQPRNPDGQNYGPPLYGVPQFGAPQYGAPPYGTPQYAPAPYGPPGMPPVPYGYSPESKVAAAVFAFFLGVFGAHNFYIGLTGRAIAQLCLTIVSWVLMVVGLIMVGEGIGDPDYWVDDDDDLIGGGAFLAIIGMLVQLAVWFWAFVEFILILMGKGRYGRDRHGFPLR